MTNFVRLNARKAKYGYKCDSVGPSNYLPLGLLLKMLYNTYAAEEFTTELVGMHRSDFRLYTDNDDVFASIESFILTKEFNDTLS